MKKQAELIILIMSLAMFSPVLGTRTAAAENTNGPSASSGSGNSTGSAREIEELELLWKLGRKAEAREKLGPLLAAHPRNATVAELASYIYLEANDLKTAEKWIGVLRELKGDSPAVLDLRGNLLVSRRRWREAEQVYGELLKLNPESRAVQRTHAEILVNERKWGAARAAYEKLIRSGADSRLRRDYYRVVDEGAPQLKTDFQYVHRPSGERDYRIFQKGSFWLTPWLKLGAGIGEEIYKKEGREEASRVDRLLLSHALRSEIYYSDFLVFKAGWQSVYYDNKDFNEFEAGLRFDKWIFHSDTVFEFNQVVRDPVEALAKHGRLDRVKTNNHFTLFDRLDFGEELGFEWFRLDGSKNELTGAERLGNRITTDSYVSLALLKRPFLAVNYHYRGSHWNQAFEGADTVIGFLPDEQIHSGGIHAEQNLGSAVDLIESVTRGSDRKRHVDFLYWTWEAQIRVNEHMKVLLSYEYDIGDSGTGGRGNSQIFSGSLNIYF